MFEKKTPYEKEWNSMRKKEQQFLKRRENTKESFLNRQLAEKVPEKLQSTLDAAFEKAFRLIFEKGTGIIDKTFQKNAAEEAYKINEYADSVKQTRRSLRAFSRKAEGSGTKNLLISGAAGIGMGFVGVGIPDIPVFTAMMLKSIYEIALSYGFSYDTKEERAFILLLIQTAVSAGDRIEEMDRTINQYIYFGTFQEEPNQDALIQSTAASLSKELLYMKFLQGIPLVGTIGGAYDVIYMKRINEYANMKYQRRFLLQKKARENV